MIYIYLKNKNYTIYSNNYLKKTQPKLGFLYASLLTLNHLSTVSLALGLQNMHSLFSCARYPLQNMHSLFSCARAEQCSTYPRSGLKLSFKSKIRLKTGFAVV